MIAIEHLDHLVLTVSRIDDTIAFYTRVLDMEVSTFAGHRKALRFGRQKINLHPAGENWESRNHPATGSADICLITSTAMSDVVEHLKKQNVPVLEGPVEKSGAQSPITSVYFNDPDRNLIEISVY